MEVALRMGCAGNTFTGVCSCYQLPQSNYIKETVFHGNNRNRNRNRNSLVVKCGIAEPSGEAAPMGQKTRYRDNFFDKAFITLFARKMNQIAGKGEGEGEGEGYGYGYVYEEFVETSRRVMQGRTPKQQQEAVRNVLLSMLPTGAPQTFRKLFPPTRWSEEFNAALTVPFFQWLVGPSEGQQHEQVDTTQQHGQKQNYTVQVDDSSPPQYASSPETDELLTFSLDSLTGVDCDSTVREYVLPEIAQLTQWEKREKIMIKEINDRYINHNQRLALFAAVQNQPGMIETLLSQAKVGTITFDNDYQDDILDAILNRLENINAEAQAYFNKWTKDADLVEIANAECNKAISKYETLKSQVKLLQVHLEKAGKSINAAIALKQTVARLNKENNALKRIIKQHGMDPTILLKVKEAENPSLLSPGDTSKEDEAIVRNLNLAAEDLISS